MSEKHLSGIYDALKLRLISQPPIHSDETTVQVLKSEEGRIPIDKNLLESVVRIFATVRKSWVFSDTVDGAKASAVVYSLMLTCRASRAGPLAWLRHALTELPHGAADADITDLLPFYFPKTATAA